MKIYKVYRLRNIHNNKLYFGYTAADNSIDRQSELYRHNKELHTDMITYGLDSFEKSDLLVTESLKKALDYESKMIIENNSLWPNGYNHVVAAKHKTQSEIHRQRLSLATRGKNNPRYGKHLADETKAKISKAMKGFRWTEEQKKAHSERLKGRKLSKEHYEHLVKMLKIRNADLEYRKHLSESLKGRKFSEEHCKNISKSKKGIHISEEHKASISAGLIGKTRTEEQKKNYSNNAANRIWYTNGVENKSCNKNDLDKIVLLESAGYYRGITSKRGGIKHERKSSHTR